MNAIVRIALARPYTFVVLALLILIIGPLAALRTPTDIFPEIRIPVIGVVWSYTGLPPDQMSGRITTPFERALTTTVNDIEHIVANSYNGIGIVKIFFQPNVDIRTANAQVTAISQTLLKQMPPGATPPLILNYNASTVPIIQLALSGEGLTEQNLADLGINQLRTPLVTVPGAAIPYPYGGKQRQIQIDLNPTALQSLGLSGQDVANALAAQNLITPVGTEKIGLFEYTIQLNNSPLKIAELGDLPIKTVNGAMIYVHDVASVRDGEAAPSRNPLVRLQRGFEASFERLRAGYRDILALALDHRPTFVIGFIGFIALSFLLVPYLGRNFFPSVDAGQILMHVRTQVGTRVEETANQFAEIQKAIRKIIPPGEIETLADNIGMPISGINMTYNNTGVIGPQDGDIQIKLREGYKPTNTYIKALREKLPGLFPGVTFAFLPADIVNQILNFGAPAPIDLEIRGANLDGNFAYAGKLLAKVRSIPGVADARIQQSPNNPTLNIDVDRTRAQYVGLTESDVTNSLVVNLAGSSQVAPTYFLDPTNGVSYSIVMQTPQYQLDSLSALQTLPMTAQGTPTPVILGGIANIWRSASNAVASQYDIQSMVQIYATPQGRDLGAVASDIRKVLTETAKDLPKGSTVSLVGQVQTMESSFSGLLFGLLGAIVLIYLLIVVNFQSWSDPFVIVTALPAALAGIIWMLFTTETTLSVPALTGAIMCMGVATANSVLVISFARERYAELGDPVTAALEAGFVRIRPVMMTALAMIIGMLPMALGLGEGGEQNAPLGRAVIGGLLFSTVATLMFVPVVFSMVHKKRLAVSTSEASQDL